MTCEEVREFCRTHPDPVDCTVAETLAVWTHVSLGKCVACADWLKECDELAPSRVVQTEADCEHVRRIVSDPEFKRILSEKGVAFRGKSI